MTLNRYARWLREGDRRQAASYGRRLSGQHQETAETTDERAQR